MASRATRVASEVRVRLVLAILEQHESEAFESLDSVVHWLLRYVGDGVIPEGGGDDPVVMLSSHSAVLTVHSILATARYKRLTVHQAIALLQASLIGEDHATV